MLEKSTGDLTPKQQAMGLDLAKEVEGTILAEGELGGEGAKKVPSVVKAPDGEVLGEPMPLGGELPEQSAEIAASTSSSRNDGEAQEDQVQAVLPVLVDEEPALEVVEPTSELIEDLGEESGVEGIENKALELIDITEQGLIDLKRKVENSLYGSARVEREMKIKKDRLNLIKQALSSKNKEYDGAQSESEEKRLVAREITSLEEQKRNLEEQPMQGIDLPDDARRQMENRLSVVEEQKKDLNRWRALFRDPSVWDRFLELENKGALSERGELKREHLLLKIPRELLRHKGMWKEELGEDDKEKRMDHFDVVEFYRTSAEEFYDLFKKMRGEEVEVEKPVVELETPEVAEAEAPVSASTPGPELVLEPEAPVVAQVEEKADVLDESDLGPKLVVPHIEDVSAGEEAVEPVESVEETPKVETIEEVKERTKGEIERFGRIKSPEAFGSVLKNMTDYVHFLKGDSKSKFVEYAARFVKNNLDLAGEVANGIPEDLLGKKIEDIPEDARKDSWWTLIFFLLELGLAGTETAVDEAVKAING